MTPCSTARSTWKSTLWSSQQQSSPRKTPTGPASSSVSPVRWTAGSLEAHPKLNPCGTTTAGVFLAGVCQGPKDIPDTVASAEGAASAASIPIHKGEVELEPYFATCIEEKCAGCGMCVNLCPYSALALVEKDGRTVMEVTEAKCKGCGTCGGFCPGGAIWMNHFATPQIVAQIDAFLLGGEQ